MSGGRTRGGVALRLATSPTARPAFHQTGSGKREDEPRHREDSKPIVFGKVKHDHLASDGDERHVEHDFYVDHVVAKVGL